MTQWTEEKFAWLSIKWFATLLLILIGIVCFPYYAEKGYFFGFYYGFYLFAMPMVLFQIWTGDLFTPHPGVDQLIGKIVATFLTWAFCGGFLASNDSYSPLDLMDSVVWNMGYALFLACVWMPSVFGRWERFFKWLPVVIYSLFMICVLIYSGGLIWYMCLES